MNRIVIIGGGISGLAAAHRVTELNKEAQVTVLEASERLGGTIQTEHRDGFLLERGPDSFISEKPHAIDLAKRLGLESQLIQTNEEFRRSFIVRDGRLRAVPEGFQLLAPSRMWPFLTSDIFSLPGKVRMAADLFLPRKSTNGASDESLASFVRRRLGQEALERMAQPMVGGIYTADPETLSLRATLPRFLDMERDHRSLILAMLRKARSQAGTEKSGTSGARYSLFLSFDRGMEVMVQALEQRLSRAREQSVPHAGVEVPRAGIRDRQAGVNGPQVEIRKETQVQSLSRTGASWTIHLSSGETLAADAICLALPAYVAATLLSDIAPQLTAKLNA